MCLPLMQFSVIYSESRTRIEALLSCIDFENKNNIVNLFLGEILNPLITTFTNDLKILIFKMTDKKVVSYFIMFNNKHHINRLNNLHLTF